MQNVMQHKDEDKGRTDKEFNDKKELKDKKEEVVVDATERRVCVVTKSERDRHMTESALLVCAPSLPSLFTTQRS